MAIQVLTLLDFREVMRVLIAEMPQKGRGEINRIAKHLGIHPSFVSQVLGGKRQLSDEQAYQTGQYFKLSNLETEYFVLLVQLDRTQNPGLKKMIQDRLSQLRSKAVHSEDLSQNPLQEHERAIFYSNWYFSAIRLMTSVPDGHTPENIARILNLPMDRVKEVLEFLVQVGLCKIEGGRYNLGAKRTFITKDSPFLSRHHLNWRVKSLEYVPKPDAKALFYTSPMSIAREDADKIRRVLLSAISEVEKIVEPSECEQVSCLNIDWFNLS